MNATAYDGHSEDEVLALDERGNSAYVPQTLIGYVDAPKGRITWAKQTRTLFHPAPAGRNDPLSAMLIVDCLMRLRPTDTIRAKYLVNLLEQLYPQMLWNAVTVGTIMGELTEIAGEAFPDPDRTPLTQKRDWRGNWWRINITADAWKWFYSIREFAGRAAEADIKAARTTNEPQKRSDSVWADLPPRVA